MDWHEFMADIEADIATFSKEVPQTVKGFGQMGQAAKADGALSERWHDLWTCCRAGGLCRRRCGCPCHSGRRD